MPTTTRSPGLTATPLRSDVLNPSIDDSDHVGVADDVRKHEIAGSRGHRFQTGAARLADERDRRSGNDAALVIFHSTRHRPGGLSEHER